MNSHRPCRKCTEQFLHFSLLLNIFSFAGWNRETIVSGSAGSNVTVASAQLPATMVLQRTFSPELRDPTSDLYREMHQLICQEVSEKKAHACVHGRGRLGGQL